MLAGKLADAYADSQTKKNVDSALYKIEAVLKNEDKEFLLEIQKKTRVFTSEDGNEPIENSAIRNIQMALYTDNIIEIQYYSPNGSQTTSRRIEPVSLGFFENHWYLIAYCHLRNAYRNFRLDPCMASGL